MQLFTPLAFKVTLILFLHDTDGFMFSAWLRSTTERNLPTLGKYKYQSYANNDAAQIGAMAPAPASAPAQAIPPAAASGYESKKEAAGTPPRAFYGPNDKDTVAAYNNQRTGISAPPKYDNRWNVLDAVVVQSIPSTPIAYVAIPAQHYPYFYYGDNAANSPQTQNVSSLATTPPALQKSVQVELNYKDATVVEKIGENVVLNRKISANPSESVQTTTRDSSAPASNATTFAAASSPVSFQRQNSTASLAPESSASTQRNLQNRPIKLLGSNTFYTSPTNFTFTPQLFYAAAPASLPLPSPPSASDIQYVPYSFLKSPLVAPFVYKNVPRAVSDRSENLPPPLPPATAFQSAGNKTGKPVCDNCLVNSNFPTYSYASKIFETNDNAFQKPCAQESASNSPTSFALKSSNLANLAYVLVPSQAIKHHPSRKR